MRHWLDDILHAFRALRRAPGFAFLAMAILALGIGANTAIFSLVDALLFRPMPIEDPDRVARIFTSDDGEDLSNFAYPSYLDYRDQASSFTGLAAYSSGMAVHVAFEGGTTERVRSGIVTGNFFQILGVKPALGRLLTPDDDGAPGANPVAVLSHHLWRTGFAGDPSIAGRTIRINRQPFTIVGVVEPRFWGTNFDGPAAIWIPMSMAEAAAPQFRGYGMLDRRGFSWLDVIGRLREGVTLEQASAEVELIAKRRVEAQKAAGEPIDLLATLRTAAEVAGGMSGIAGTMRTISWILLAVVALVLLIACADVAGLMLVRGERRRQEIAVRLALGSERGRIIRQLLVESVLVAALASIAAVLVATWLVKIFIAALPPGIPFPFEITASVLDGRVLAVTACIALLSGVAFGILPALRVSRTDLATAMNRQTGRVAGRSRLGSTFVVLQVTLASVLLVGAGLLLRTLWNAHQVDPGFDPEGKLAVSLDLARQGYSEEAVPARWNRILEEVGRLPGVRAVALGSSVPVQPGGMRNTVEVEGYEPPPGVVPNVDLMVVTADYFDALGVRLVRGRGFSEADVSEGRHVAIINRAAAEEFWRGRDPIGEQIGGVNAEVIGIVENVRARSLLAPPQPAVYRPHAQLMLPVMTLLVRSDLRATEITKSVAAAVAAVDPELPLYDTWTLEQKIGNAMAKERLLGGLLGAFALLALVLSAGGLYSLIAFTTQARTREFGIRMALGAERRTIAATILRETLSLVLAGLLLGTAIAMGVTRFAAALLFGVSPLDPGTYIAVAAVLVLAGLAAGQIPAMRAMRTDPANVLRHE